MAVQVNSERAAELPRPHLYVIDFTRPRPAAPPHVAGHPRSDQLAHLRRRRRVRRLHQAGSVASWAGASAILLFLLLGGLAGLR